MNQGKNAEQKPFGGKKARGKEPKLKLAHFYCAIEVLFFSSIQWYKVKLSERLAVTGIELNASTTSALVTTHLLVISSTF